MEKQNNYKYCPVTTQQHHLAKRFVLCVEKFNDVMSAEGEKRTVFKNEICINLDKVEQSLAQAEKRCRHKTMDICFGVLKNNTKHLVLCECRFNYQNVKNLSKSELDNKISYSKELVGNEITIHQYIIFLFNIEIKQQAFSRLRRLYSNKNILKVLDINEFKQEYFG